MASKNNKLGLPVEYKKHPEYFDAFNINEDTETHNAVIEKLLNKYNVKTVLDMTCGTGSQVFHLIKHGYIVTGSDFSPALLTIAREKAKKEKINVEFVDGDMRTLKLGQFDAVITIFNAIGHLTKSGFATAIRNIRRNLKDGGIYIFDILNLEAMTDKFIADDCHHNYTKINDMKLHAVQFSTLDRENSRLICHHYDMTQKNIDEPKLSKTKCSLQIYTAFELKEILANNGFETIAQYAMDGSKFLKDSSNTILTIARKL